MPSARCGPHDVDGAVLHRDAERAVENIDSRAMLIHIERGKTVAIGAYPSARPYSIRWARDWRRMKPKTWLFPGTIAGWVPTSRSPPKLV